MKSVIEVVKEQKELHGRLSIAIGYMKGHKESIVGKKEFTVEEVLELLETIRSSNNG